MDKEYIIEAMDYIIKETKWADIFPYLPYPSLKRIREVCEAVKAEKPLPFKDVPRSGP